MATQYDITPEYEKAIVTQYEITYYHPAENLAHFLEDSVLVASQFLFNQNVITLV